MAESKPTADPVQSDPRPAAAPDWPAEYAASLTKTALSVIADQTFTRASVADGYSLLIRLMLSYPDAVTIDWQTINEAIMARWSVSGLNWIKKQAWNAVRANSDKVKAARAAIAKAEAVR